jgi:cytochrome c553
MMSFRQLILLILLLTAMPAGAASFNGRKAQCVACHGENGISQTAEVPSLGGQPELFVLFQLVAFRDGQRKAPVMNEVMADLSDDDMRAAAAFVSALPPPPEPKEAGDPQRMAHGKALADKNRCGFCHGENYAGHDQIPRIAHQREDYLLKALREYKSQKRFGSGAAMNEVVYPLSDKDLGELAYFMAHAP